MQRGFGNALAKGTHCVLLCPDSQLTYTRTLTQVEELMSLLSRSSEWESRIARLETGAGDTPAKKEVFSPVFSILHSVF